MSDLTQLEYSRAQSTATDGTSPDDARGLIVTVAQAAEDRKAVDIVLLRVSEVSYLADYFAIVTGFSNVQVRAISQAIADQVEEEWQRLPLRTQGLSDASWVVMDYGDAIVHILKPQEREFYNLEAFWGHAERIDFSPAR
ncbi:iojap-like protein [Oscillatoria nigro-viridis PCC 7112]|uniref:Ribosomal silencing factor RsfS n=1 Tax=Phormidium nigroviride PCC 7112 TaxID=179408 RepID=K9VMY5_9CYAN|nr:ribosome silencing factor [Oscillatoria nigro-viridis]AFZ09316.1 iojap-like protein [Oscillatoria nigro-viridis PCC 7112]